jgi:selenocysteine-specific elongation factor
VEPVEGGRLRLTGFAPGLSAEQDERRSRIETILEEARFATPREDQLPDEIGATPQETAKLLDLLIDQGRVIRLAQGVVMHARAVEEIKGVISEFVAESGEIGPADLKNLVGMSRKYSIPLFEWLDARRFTIRKGDRRILA